MCLVGLLGNAGPVKARADMCRKSWIATGRFRQAVSCRGSRIEEFFHCGLGVFIEICAVRRLKRAQTDQGQGAGTGNVDRDRNVAVILGVQTRIRRLLRFVGGAVISLSAND
jgi:hypothetical protein